MSEKGIEMFKRIVSAMFGVLLFATALHAQQAPQGPFDSGRGRAFVDQLKRDNPNTFACAHTPAACGFNFIKVLACKLNPEPSNGPWGLNGKRGTSDLSWDALNYRGAGNGTDAFNGGPVQVIDVISGAGGPNPQADWQAFTNPQEASGRWIKPRCRGDVAIDSNGNVLVPPVTPTPTPTPTPQPCPPQKPCPPAHVTPPYPGDDVFDAIANVLFADYAESGQAPNAGMGRWFGRTVYDWLAGNTKTLDESIKKHRAEWLELLPKK